MQVWNGCQVDIAHCFIAGAISIVVYHDDVITWKGFPHYWPSVNFDVSLMLARTNFSANIRMTGDWDVIKLISRHCNDHHQNDVNCWTYGITTAKTSHAIHLTFTPCSQSSFHNISRPEYNGRHFAKRNFQIHFLGWKSGAKPLLELTAAKAHTHVIGSQWVKYAWRI